MLQVVFRQNLLVNCQLDGTLAMVFLKVQATCSILVLFVVTETLLTAANNTMPRPA